MEDSDDISMIRERGISAPQSLIDAWQSVPEDCDPVLWCKKPRFLVGC